MAEDTIESLRARVADLITQLTEANSEAKDRRLENKRLVKELETITVERDDFKKKAEAPPSDEVKTLRAQLLERDHRDTWKGLQGDAEIGLNPKIPIEKVWKNLDYRPDGEASPEKIKALLLKARETDHHLFVEGTATAGTDPNPEAEVRLAGTPALNGTGGTGGRAPAALAPTTAQLQDPRWMYENQHRFATPEGERRGW